MKSSDWIALLALAMLWGGSFLFIRVAAPVLGPIPLIEVRVLIAGLALLAYGLATGRLRSPGARWPHYLVLGVLNTAFPFVLIAAAELTLPASLAATLNASTPLFGALLAALWLKQSFSGGKWIGLLLGFLGVGALVGLGPLPVSGPMLLAMGASLLAAFCYAVSSLYAQARLAGAPALEVSTYSLLFAALALLPGLALAGPIAPPSGAVIGCVLALGLGSTAFAYLLYFRLLANVGPVQATMVTYLSPLFGVLWGWAFLGEALGWGLGIGFALIAASVWLVNARPRP